MLGIPKGALHFIPVLGIAVVLVVKNDVTGRSLASLAQDLIFDKLGMPNSTFDSLLPEAFRPQAAIAHQANGVPVPGNWHTYPEQAPASLWSTPTDLGHLLVEILKSHNHTSDLVLSTEMTRQMPTPQAGWMGLGFVVVELDGWTRFDHPGWNEGFHSYFAGCLGAGQGVVWMANGENGKLLGQEVMRALASLLGWSGYRPVEKSVSEVDPVNLSHFEGEFRFVDYPDFGVEIFLDCAYLYCQESLDGIRYQLFPESEFKFFCLHHPETFTFFENDEGEVDSIVIGQYSNLVQVE